MFPLFPILTLSGSTGWDGRCSWQIVEGCSGPPHTPPLVQILFPGIHRQFFSQLRGHHWTGKHRNLICKVYTQDISVTPPQVPINSKQKAPIYFLLVKDTSESLQSLWTRKHTMDFSTSSLNEIREVCGSCKNNFLSRITLQIQKKKVILQAEL